MKACPVFAIITCCALAGCATKTATTPGPTVIKTIISVVPGPVVTKIVTVKTPVPGPVLTEIVPGPPAITCYEYAGRVFLVHPSTQDAAQESCTMQITLLYPKSNGVEILTITAPDGASNSYTVTG